MTGTITLLGHIPVYVRGRSVLPLQQPALTTREGRTRPWDFLVALDKNGSARGNLYLDDCVSTQPNATLAVKFAVRNRKLDTVSSHGGWVDGNSLQKITIRGVDGIGSGVRFNGRNVSNSNVQFDSDKHTLVVLDSMSRLGLEATGSWSGRFLTNHE